MYSIDTNRRSSAHTIHKLRKMRWSRSTKRNSIAHEKEGKDVPSNSNSSSNSLYHHSRGSISNASLESTATNSDRDRQSNFNSTDSHASVTSSATYGQESNIPPSTSMGTISDKHNGTSVNLHPTTSHATTALNDDHISTMTRSLNSFNLGNNANGQSTASKNRPFSYDNYDSSVIKTGWINKGTNINNYNNASSDSWKIYKAELKGPVLSLYKLPAELNIKSFDPTLNENGQSTQSVRQKEKRLSTMSSKANLKSGIGSPVTPTTPTTFSSQIENSKNMRVKLKYFSDVYPHPDLQLNSVNSIVSGTLESICHTVLFNTLDDDKLSYNLLLIMPLFGDIKTSLKYFYELSITFSNQRFNKSSGKVFVSSNTDYAITQRLGLVVTTIIDAFPGMLLDEDIVDLIVKLLSGIATHDEHLTTRLKSTLLKKEETMKTLTSFRRSAYDPKGSQTLISVDKFFELDSRLLAEQINLINLRFNRSWNPKSDASLLYELEGMTYPRLNPLIFNSTTNIHYLGRLIVNHLFGGAQDEQQRERVLQKWIEIGCIFDKIGDMVSWLAIATMICSIPVLRLKNTWSCIDEKYLKIISSEWAPVVFELDRRYMISEASHRSSYHVIAPQGLGTSYPKEDVVPYFGDLTVKFVEGSTLKQCEKRVQRVKISFSRWDEYLEKLEQDDELFKDTSKQANTGLQKELYNLLSNHVSLSPLNLESVMELSMSVEPDAISSYNKLHESRTPLLTGSYLPTLFSEIVPSYKLFNQNVLIGAGGFTTKDTATSEQEFQKVTGVDDVDIKSFALNSKLPSSRQNAFLKSVRDIFNIGSDVFHVDDDLIFKSLGDELKHSRPASVVLETPSSKRLSQLSNHRLSQIPHSNRGSTHMEAGSLEADDDVFAILDSSNLLNSLIKPLNVVLKAGTFDKMVDVLVLTSNIFSKKIDKKDIDTYLEKSNFLDNQFLKLKMNNGVYTSTFFTTYRSFASTTQLLDALFKRFKGARSAAISIQKFNAESKGELPDWEQNISVDDVDLNWKFVGNIQIGVLEAISILVSEHYSDFTDDLKNKNTFVNLLRATDNEIVVVWKDILQRFESSTELSNELTEIYNVLQNLYKKIRKTYIKKCYRPLEGYPGSLTSTQSQSFTGDLNQFELPKDFREAEVFVNKLDVFINNLFSGVTISDWITVFQLLEIHAGKSLISLFRYKWASTKDESKLEILNVFSWMRNLYGDNPQDLLLAKLPPPVKRLFELHDNLEKFFKVHISDPKTSRKDRNAKMVSVLQILTITRLRMKGVDLFHNTSKFDAADNVSPHVPSFLETAIVQAIVSPESRAYDASWVYSSSADYSKEVTDLLPNLDVDDLTDELRGSLTPCCGWFTERLMEIANFVPNMSIENSKLINFDKRRFTYNCVSNIADMNLEEADPLFVEKVTAEFSFLFQLSDYPVANLNEIAEVAAAETSQLRMGGKTPLFANLLEREQEKIKRDAKKREVLENQERDLKRTQLMSQARASVSLSRDMTNTGPAPNDSQKELRKGRNTSSPNKSTGMKRLGGLFKSVRPFSINVGSSWSGPDRIVHPDDLPEVAQVDLAGKHSKPYQQVKLFRTKPLFVHSNIEGFFKLVGENGGEEYCFQAPSNAEAQRWIAALNMSKRYTYLSRDSQGLMSSKVFGVPIADVCEREGSLMPSIVDKLLEEIELRGLDETGLYRVPGSVGSINLLKQAFDEGSDFTLEDDRWFEINTLAGCFKSYLRELPESLLTNELQPEFVLATREGDLTENLRALVTQLPVNNYHLLKRLFEHLNRVIQHSDSNRMDAVNLAIVFSMSFINNDNIGASMGSDLGALQTIIQHLIKDPSSVFCESMSDAASVYAA